MDWWSARASRDWPTRRTPSGERRLGFASVDGAASDGNEVAVAERADLARCSTAKSSWGFAGRRRSSAPVVPCWRASRKSRGFGSAAVVIGGPGHRTRRERALLAVGRRCFGNRASQCGEVLALVGERAFLDVVAGRPEGLSRAGGSLRHGDFTGCRTTRWSRRREVRPCAACRVGRSSHFAQGRPRRSSAVGRWPGAGSNAPLAVGSLEC